MITSASCGASGKLRREEAAQAGQPLQLADLLRHALLEGAVPPDQLVGLPLDRRQVLFLLVVQSLLLQASADAGPQQHRIERLGQVVLRAHLDAAHHALQLV
jgi:hypothetical protein